MPIYRRRTIDALRALGTHLVLKAEQSLGACGRAEVAHSALRAIALAAAAHYSPAEICALGPVQQLGGTSIWFFAIKVGPAGLIYEAEFPDSRFQNNLFVLAQRSIRALADNRVVEHYSTVPRAISICTAVVVSALTSPFTIFIVSVAAITAIGNKNTPERGIVCLMTQESLGAVLV